VDNQSELKQTRKLGRHMLILGWLIGLALLAYLFNDIINKQHNPNQQVQSSINPQGVREVRLKRNRQGHYVASGTINDHPVVFLLDTGATVVSIPENIATRLELKAGPASYANTANGVIRIYSTRLDSVGIGGIHLDNVPAHINPHMSSNEVLLGMSFLKKLELIQKGDNLTLKQSIASN
jgi:aspartyl protease family protein